MKLARATRGSEDKVFAQALLEKFAFWPNKNYTDMVCQLNVTTI